MSIFDTKGRVFVLGIDGVPHSFLQKKFAGGEMPHLARLVKDGTSRRMNSVYPAISSAAWTCYSTGKNPAEHDILGFVDRTLRPFDIRIPTARDIKSETLWAALSKMGKKVIVINVPLTYPPERVNGILIAGFPCPSIEKSSYPDGLGARLKEKGYIVDANALLARESRRKLMDQIRLALDKRIETALGLMGTEKWDLFQLHIMETDRLFHFFFDNIESGEFHNDVRAVFETIDGFIGTLREKLSREDKLVVLSDHGFCGTKYEVQLNAWLAREGLLKFKNEKQRKLPLYDESSVCYSLIPGRIFVNLKGREPKGTVENSDYDRVRGEIKEKLLGFAYPETGEKIIAKVFFREEIYSGPYLENAADIIAHPVDGFDLKGQTDTEEIFCRSHINGMHTFDDAFICGINADVRSVDSIQDVRGKCFGV